MQGKLILSSGGVNLKNLQKEVVYHATHKRCTKKDCEHNGESQPITNFSKQDSTLDGRSDWCKDCRKKYQANRKRLREADNFLKAF
jgi:hypothetical protein